MKKETNNYTMKINSEKEWNAIGNHNCKVSAVYLREVPRKEMWMLTLCCARGAMAECPLLFSNRLAYCVVVVG